MDFTQLPLSFNPFIGTSSWSICKVTINCSMLLMTKVGILGLITRSSDIGTWVLNSGVVCTGGVVDYPTPIIGVELGAYTMIMRVEA